MKHYPRPRPEPTSEEFLALLILFGPLVYVVRWVWRSSYLNVLFVIDPLAACTPGGSTGPRDGRSIRSGEIDSPRNTGAGPPDRSVAVTTSATIRPATQRRRCSAVIRTASLMWLASIADWTAWYCDVSRYSNPLWYGTGGEPTKTPGGGSGGISAAVSPVPGSGVSDTTTSSVTLTSSTTSTAGESVGVAERTRVSSDASTSTPAKQYVE